MDEKGVHTMNVSREDKKTEAVKRMKTLGIYRETIRQFKDDDEVSESAPPFGACFWLNDEQKKRVQEFEEKYNALVYHVIHSYFEDCETEDYLYVSDSPDEWEMEQQDILEKCLFVYTYVVSDPICSEFGTIGVQRTQAAGLKRMW